MLGFFLFKVFLVVFAVPSSLDFLILSFRCFATSASLRGIARPILKVVQLVGAMVVLFAIVHYYVALLSDVPAYKDMHLPIREFGWGNEIIDRMFFVPSWDTILDCIYFSTITTATIGYGDIYPLTRAAKIATIIQTIFSFGLIAVALGWVIGHAQDEAKK